MGRLGEPNELAPTAVFLASDAASYYRRHRLCRRWISHCGEFNGPPIVAIVGRPNVGKSSLFNWLANRRISIVDPTAGVTRDRVSTVVEYGGRAWELTDTGGIGIVDVDNLTADVEQQIQIAIDTASVVLFVVDVRDGIVPLDEEVAGRLRTLTKPIMLVANKADTDKLGQQVGEFFKFGYGDPPCVAAEQKLGKEELFDAILEKLPPDTGELAPAERPCSSRSWKA